MNYSNISIELNGIVKRFSSDQSVVPALSKISATIKRGTITGLVGADGSGKTTLLRIIAGLLSLTEGRVLVEGLDPIQESDRLHTILGYMPQKFGLYEDLSVMENLMLYADLRGVAGETRKTAFKQLLDFTDLSYFTERKAGNLSGGMKQKLGLACALLGNPKVLLLDEPTVGVDPISRRELWKMVNDLISKGMTVIWSTSYLYEAELCHDVLVMNKGHLIYSGKPNDLTDKMVGRSIQVQHIQKNPRVVLENAMHSPEVIDGIIQGSYVRLVLKEAGKNPDLNTLKAGPDALLLSTKPRFEDAFVDLLGGISKKNTTLSSITKSIRTRPQNEIVIEAKELTKQFGNFFATNKISFKVQRGTIFCLLGPNGAGKSTIFKMMCGLLTPTAGTATILGIDLQKEPYHARQQIGYMAQKFSLYDDLTVQQNLQFISGIYGLSGKNRANIISQMLNLFNLTSYLTNKTNELPIGFKQRLALACAIMHKPAILFLDEPTSGVDPIARREFWLHINELVENGVTVIVTTHFMDEAEYSDQIGLIYRGKLIANGTPDQLKQQVVSAQLPNPTMEDAFIELIKEHDKNYHAEPKKSEEPSHEGKLLQKLDQSHFLIQHESLRRLMALCRKEFYQIIRDPSSILMAFILPLVLIFIYGFGINLDTSKIRLGMVLNDQSPEVWRFEKSFADSPYIDAIPMNLATATQKLTAGTIRGFVMIQSDFTKRLKEPKGVAPVQIITDGSEPNTASFVTAYAEGAWQNWLTIRSLELAQPLFNSINIEPRYWYNPAVISRFFLVPGSIVLVMTVIGALLTSLVVAREWERGTMEALLSTPMTRQEFLYSKLIPYYLLGIIAMMVCTITAITILNTPFRGSVIWLFIVSTLFLGSILGLGLFLSTLIRNQFNAAQAALNIAYLPATLLSGFVFEISSMPPVIQGITYFFPARYFVSCLQTLFLAGNVIELLFKNSLFLVGMTVLFLSLVYQFTRQRVD